MYDVAEGSAESLGTVVISEHAEVASTVAGDAEARGWKAWIRPDDGVEIESDRGHRAVVMSKAEERKLRRHRIWLGITTALGFILEVLRIAT